MNDPFASRPIRPQLQDGFLLADGSKGIRNLVLVIYTVECAKHVAHAIQNGEPGTQVIGFPGCYDNAYAIRLLLALGRHPNVGVVLSVGLGCEYTQPSKIADAIRQSGRPAESFFIQQSGGTTQSVKKGKEIVARLRDKISTGVKRVPLAIEDLVIGCECGGSECGGSDFTSGLAGNPVVGQLFDQLVEMIGLRDVLLSRAASASAQSQIASVYDKAVDYCKSVKQYLISPGNFAGGLTTIEEKSIGAVAESGSRPIQGVIRVAEQPPRPGLWILDSVPDLYFVQFGYTNPNDTEDIMDLISVGAQIVLFVTGRGSVIGSPTAPLVKITGNSDTNRKLEDDMDFDAGRVLSGEQSLDDAAGELFDLVVRTANGQPSKPESLGHHECFIMYKHQDVPSLNDGCRA